MRYKLLDEKIIDKLQTLDRADQAQWLFLDPSEEFKGRWSVDALWPDWYFDFQDMVGSYRTLSPARLDEFLSLADELEYTVVFNDPPEKILEVYDGLREPPPFSLLSNYENTIQGFFPWQIEAFNKLIRDETLDSGLVVHSTGMGKTVFIISAILWHNKEGHPYDLGLVVVKSNNKADMNRKLKRLGNIDSIIIDGTPKRRAKLYAEVYEKLKTEKVIAITNYEKFREDPEQLKALIKGKDCLIWWDEVPTRLSNRGTKLYKSVKNVIWKRFQSKENGLADCEPNAKWLRQWGLTATPIENSPEGLFNYLRLMNPPLLGKVEEFYTEYVYARNYFSKKPEQWMNLDRLEAKIEHMTHRASREHDPEIAKMFPRVFEDTLVIDWHSTDRKIYDILTGKAKEIVEADFSEANILAMIQVLQMLCDAPSMVNTSSANRKRFEELADEFEGPVGSSIADQLIKVLQTQLKDDNHTKLETLKEILLEKHPDDKALIFMTWASYGIKPLAKKLSEWGVTYIAYEGTQKQADDAKNRFREQDDIRVFLSSDRGADSIDLPEAAIGINYNLPWTWVRKRQRMRNVRVDSKLTQNYWYDLIMANSVEERKQDIIHKKYQYHAALFDGNVVDEALAAKLSREDLFFILTGSSVEE